MSDTNIGKLTTPTGEGVSVIVRDTDIIIDNNLLINNKVISKNINTSTLTIVGANTNNGAALVLSGSERNDDECGSFQLAAQATEPNEFTNSNGRIWLSGRTNNKLLWNNKLIDSIYSSSTHHIQYTNGLLICWGSHAVDTVVTFPVTFMSNPTITYGYTGYSTNNYSRVFVVYGYNFSTTGLSMRIYDVTNSEFITANAEYIAIGRWK